MVIAMPYAIQMQSLTVPPTGGGRRDSRTSAVELCDGKLIQVVRAAGAARVVPRITIITLNLPYNSTGGNPTVMPFLPPNKLSLSATV